MTEENIQSYLDEINDNKLKPFVMFDSKGEEGAIVYTKIGYQICPHVNSKGELAIEISDNLYLGRMSLFKWRKGRI